MGNSDSREGTSRSGERGLDPLEPLLPFTLSFQLQSKMGASEDETKSRRRGW